MARCPYYRSRRAGDPALPLADWQDPTKGGFHAATCDPEYVTALWSHTAPGSNIALAVPPGVVVIDLDDREGESAAGRLADEYPDLAALLPDCDTFRVKSPSGAHIYFRTDAEIPSSHAKGGDYSGVRSVIDLKVGGKSYVLLPPSFKGATGTAYEHLAGDLGDLAEVPAEWVAALLETAPERPQEPRKAVPLAPSTFTAPEPVRLPQGVLESGTARHPILLREAGHLRARGWGEEAIRGGLLSLNRQLFASPKPDQEIDKLVADVCSRYAAGEIGEPDNVELPEFTKTDLYKRLVDVCGSAESVDYILDAACAPVATAPRRVVCLAGDPDTTAGLMAAIERGFDGLVAHLPYAALMPGAMHTRRTDYLSVVDGARLLLFAGGPADPKIDAGVWWQFAQRKPITYSRKGEGATVYVAGATIVQMYGQPAVNDARMQSSSAVFPLSYGRIDPTDDECRAMVRYGRTIHEPGRAMPEANQWATAAYFPIEPWTEAKRELSFSEDFIDGREAIRAMVNQKFIELAPTAELPSDLTIPRKTRPAVGTCEPRRS